MEGLSKGNNRDSKQFFNSLGDLREWKQGWQIKRQRSLGEPLESHGNSSGIPWGWLFCLIQVAVGIPQGLPTGVPAREDSVQIRKRALAPHFHPCFEGMGEEFQHQSIVVIEQLFLFSDFNLYRRCQK